MWRTTTAALRAWLAMRGTARAPELFVNARGASFTRSGIEYILRKHVQTAKQQCPSLATKRVFPHLLRHMCALTVLQATKDLRKVSLWLGHAHMQTTEMYTRADPSVKLEAPGVDDAAEIALRAFQGNGHADRVAQSPIVMRSETPS